MIITLKKVLRNFLLFTAYYFLATWDRFAFIPDYIRLIFSSVILPIFIFFILNKFKSRIPFSLEKEIKISKFVLDSLLIISAAIVLYTLEIGNQEIDTLKPYGVFRHLKILPLYITPLRIYIEFYQLSKE